MRNGSLTKRSEWLAGRDCRVGLNDYTRVNLFLDLFYIEISINTFVILVNVLAFVRGMIGISTRHSDRFFSTHFSTSVSSRTLTYLTSMSRECPSVAQLIAAVKSLTRANDGTFQTAWKDSFIDAFHCCEQGGYIYIGMPYFHVNCNSINAHRLPFFTDNIAISDAARSPGTGYVD